MSNATIAPVRRSVLVQAPAERAFEVFTAGLASWWPASHSIVEGGYGTVVVEPHEGGRLYERGQTGAECVWGRVLAWEPPGRLTLSWHLDEEWRVDPDPARASEIEVTFAPAGDGTRVELEHRGWDEPQTGDRANYDRGWEFVLGKYVGAAR